jgi:hypothetical protein
MVYRTKGTDGIMDRRQSPRIKFTRNKPGFYITLFLERFFFKDREIICKLRDLSEGGASLLVNDEFKKYFSEHSVGKSARIISENPEVSFRLSKKGRVMRVINHDGDVTVVVVFTKQPG